MVRLKDRVVIIIGGAKGACKIFAMSFAKLLSTSTERS